MCPLEDQESAAYSVHCLFRWLGIDFASEGKKAPDFSGLFNTCGLQLDVRRLPDGLFTVGHTEKRINELVRTLHDYSRLDLIAPKRFGEASWQTGVVQFLHFWEEAESCS